MSTLHTKLGVVGLGVSKPTPARPYGIVNGIVHTALHRTADSGLGLEQRPHCEMTGLGLESG